MTTIEFTKEEVSSLMRVYVKEGTVQEDFSLSMSVCKKVGELFGMFHDPSVDKICLKKI